ncbi:hypothetical protein G5V57_30475 [Nordella sp. HKS 07]|uniref:hypothetical protein n=1 Tax=Nordella sp. HKS 07 TaxID=2712222 RepID=UPI0013E1A21D|nr:hypothetical protein [Nordella sp. HKS 07]QIG51662.1 hypothetical protein G5V57_30475 [Nordella sp. HKS 07]
MRIFTIFAVFSLFSAGQALAGPGAQSIPKLSQGVAPQLARSHVATYNIVEAKVVEGVKYQNTGAAKGVSRQPGKMIFQTLPTRG